MREILVRGVSIESEEWVEGYYVCLNGKEHRIYDGYAEADCGEYYPDWETVDPGTVGQYTGLTDKNGKRIFEGDIVEYGGGNYKVVFETREGSAYYGIAMDPMETWSFCFEVPAKLMKVIGNIHDNPELLEGVK